MFAVFDKSLQNDVGKSLVRKYNSTDDAQAVFCKLYPYTLQSTKASMDAASLLS